MTPLPPALRARLAQALDACQKRAAYLGPGSTWTAHAATLAELLALLRADPTPAPEAETEGR